MIKSSINGVILNKNGVRVMDFDPGIPFCCTQCKHFEQDWSEWSNKTYRYCTKNIFMPTKRGACKKQDATYWPQRRFEWWLS